MATTGSHRPLSYYLFPSPASRSPDETKSAPRPRRRPTTSHYRPVSQLLSEESDDPQPHTTQGVSRRNSVSLFMSIPDRSLLEMVHRSKEKGKEREGRIRKMPSYTPPTDEVKASVNKERPSHLRPGLINKASVDSFKHVDTVPTRIHNDSIICHAEDVFVKKRVWHRHGSMRLHPYPGDAVYMQSYDPVVLENEKYSYLLFRRLSSSIPTFSTSMDKPPANVLDLGCGQGHWLLDASNHWPSTEFTGFDLVDVMLPEVQEKKNIRLVRGNFVKYALPFSDKSFDFVRMANLSLAIPHEKWSFVVSEVRRVLTIGGQLELIDDQLFFPYGPSPVIPPPSPPSCSRDRRRSRGQRHSLDCETETDSGSPTLSGCETADTDSTLTNERVKPEPLWPATKVSQRRSKEYVEQWAITCQTSRDVEGLFVDMLRKRLVHPSPKEFVSDLLRYTFGSGNVSKTRTFDIKLAPASSTQQHRIDPPTNTSADSLLCPDQDSGDLTEEKNRRHSLVSDEDSPTQPVFPLRHSAKAAGRLGISYSDLVVATAAARRPIVHGNQSYHSPITRGPQQSPGIIIAPSTFIPLTTVETEFHACKWIHTLLGCRPALVDYVRSRTDETGRTIVDDAELNDALWTYESFRRQRFHWPINAEHDPESFTSPCIVNARKSDLPSLLEGHEEPVHIRTIQVHHATKTEMTSLASLLFSPPSSH